jgi:chemotaxis protein MotB
MSLRKGRTQGGGGGGGHDGGGMLRWLLTYADMITLLMAFFIMMYSMSILNLAKFQQVAFSIRSGFGGSLQGGEGVMVHGPGPGSVKPNLLGLEGGAGLSETAVQLAEFITQRGLEEAVRLRVDERGLIISLVTDKVLFDLGKANLKPGSRDVLDKIAGLLQRLPNQVMVEGHSCNLPIRTAQFPSNWELSTARATQVIRYFIERRGVPATRLSAAGYADSRPLLPNTSAANRARNRRVDIVILRSSQDQGPRAERPAPVQGDEKR